MSERDEQNRRYLAGTWALHALKVFELVHPSRLPFEIVAAYMGDRVVTSVQRHALGELEDRILACVDLLGVQSGALVGAQYALAAVKLLLTEPVDHPQAMKLSDRAHAALVESAGRGGVATGVD